MIEVRIRVLMKGDMGDVVPSVTLTNIKKPEALNVEQIAADLIAELPPELGNLRLMTAEEADVYCEQERLDEERDADIMEADS